MTNTEIAAQIRAIVGNNQTPAADQLRALADTIDPPATIDQLPGVEIFWAALGPLAVNAEGRVVRSWDKPIVRIDGIPYGWPTAP